MIHAASPSVFLCESTQLRAYMRANAASFAPTATPRFIRWFADIRIEDVPLVGGKNASLGEMFRELTSEGVRVPDGFATTAEAYRHFLPDRPAL